MHDRKKLCHTDLKPENILLVRCAARLCHACAMAYLWLSFVFVAMQPAAGRVRMV